LPPGADQKGAPGERQEAPGGRLVSFFIAMSCLSIFDKLMNIVIKLNVQRRCIIGDLGKIWGEVCQFVYLSPELISSPCDFLNFFFRFKLGLFVQRFYILLKRKMTVKTRIWYDELVNYNKIKLSSITWLVATSSML